MSEDLVCASRAVSWYYSPNLLQNNTNHLVLGSEAQNATFNCWEVEMGSSKHWTLGVCPQSAAESDFIQPLTPQNGFWGLCRNGDVCYVLGSTQPIQLTRTLEKVQVKLVRRIDLRKWKLFWVLSFVDAGRRSEIACIDLEIFRRDLFPFFIPEDRNAPLCIIPVNVNLTNEEKFRILERHMDMIPLYGIFMVLCVFFLMMAFWFL